MLNMSIDPGFMSRLLGLEDKLIRTKLFGLTKEFDPENRSVRYLIQTIIPMNKEKCYLLTIVENISFK